MPKVKIRRSQAPKPEATSSTASEAMPKIRMRVSPASKLEATSSTRSTSAQVAQSFRGGRNPRLGDIFIAVMGVTGSGKSSFISLCSKKSVKIGHDLTSCTSTVDVYAYDVSRESTVYLIDTPGFNDSTKTDREVLREIASWLGSSYTSEIRLHGIIYLHRISDIRMQGSAKKNLIMFKKLCGPDALKRVILVTSMWDKVPAEEGTRREEELLNTEEFWGYMMSKGSTCRRHSNTLASAREIVQCLTKHSSAITTNIQQELVDEKRTLEDTSAGRELESELRKEREMWTKQLRETEEEMKEAIRLRDREAEKMMREERDRFSHLIKKAEAETGSLRLTMEHLLSERDKRVASMEKKMQKQQATYDKELKEVKEKQNRLEREKADLQKAKENDTTSRAITTVTTVSNTPTTSSVKVYAPYSVTLSGTTFAASSPRYIQSNSKHPKRKEDNTYRQAATFGSIHNGTLNWIARYQNGDRIIWKQSRDIGQAHPDLAAKLSLRGLNNLQVCALGPSGFYYARWLDGYWQSWAPAKANEDLTQCHKGDWKVVAMAWGYGGSYFMSFGLESNMRGLGYRLNLQGFYPKLSEFLNANGNISVQRLLSAMDWTRYVQKNDTAQALDLVFNQITFGAIRGGEGPWSTNQQSSVIGEARYAPAVEEGWLRRITAHAFLPDFPSAELCRTLPNSFVV
ncbi:hypothetical protein B0J13DRAFT_681560 [Dactylonectria estremocensis]|uniref:G domain-containing protein n=1 Tax=Dactylonectria estremocensis TaxID=1079267 RepID=A0A9P9ICS1_9HYPO|nr:hypothetical protein B0J13DRAFT_681560 [Dactylonectria estremocensis]